MMGPGTILRLICGGSSLPDAAVGVSLETVLELGVSLEAGVSYDPVGMRGEQLIIEAGGMCLVIWAGRRSEVEVG